MPLDEMPDTSRVTDTAISTLSTRFRPGVSGNPRGRPKGSRNRSTLLREEERIRSLDTHTAALLMTLVRKAYNGNLGAIRTVLARTEPAPRDRRLSLDLPAIDSLDDAVDAMDRVLDQVSGGDLSPREGQAVGRLIETQARLIERRNKGHRTGQQTEHRENQEIQAEKQEIQVPEQDAPAPVSACSEAPSGPGDQAVIAAALAPGDGAGGTAPRSLWRGAALLTPAAPAPRPACPWPTGSPSAARAVR